MLTHTFTKYVTSKHCLRNHAGCVPEPGHHIGGLGRHPEDDAPGDDLPHLRQSICQDWFNGQLQYKRLRTFYRLAYFPIFRLDLKHTRRIGGR